MRAEELLVRLAQRRSVNFEQRASGRVNGHRQPRAVERDQSRRQARHNPLAEFLRRVRTLTRFSTQLLELPPLLLQLRHNGLKRLQHKLRFVLRLHHLIRDVRPLCFAEQFVIRTQQPAQQKQNAEQTADQNRDERSEQDWTTCCRRVRREHVQTERKQDRQQKECRQHRQSGLKASSVSHLNWPAYHCTIGTPNSSAAIAPSPRNTPNGSSICMSFRPARTIRNMPMIEPVRTPTKIVRIVSRQPRYAPTMNIIFTSPRPIASMPRSFSQVQPISQSEPPPTNAPMSAPTSDVTQIGIPASAPCESDGRSSKCGV